jgi:hypothetical protein
MIALPHVKPLPKAAKTTVSPVLIFPFSQASVKAIRSGSRITVFLNIIINLVISQSKLLLYKLGNSLLDGINMSIFETDKLLLVLHL